MCNAFSIPIFVRNPFTNEAHMQWAPRLHPWRIQQLYKRTQIGILDEDQLQHIGWRLFARGESVLTFGKAMRGQVPCPKCNEIVYRKIYRRKLQQKAHDFSCPTCAEQITWQGCRNALRNRPRCFGCNQDLDWDYTQNTLSCPKCQIEWTWQKYRQSIKHRVKLPCPHCHTHIRKPVSQKNNETNAPQASAHWDFTCPACKQQGQHIKGSFLCTNCGYTLKWQNFTKRQKRRIEHLHCQSCNHTFTWQSWKRQFDSAFAHTGNPTPIRQFVSQWPKCKSPGEQLITIDRLIHALHGRGALAPIFIKGDQHSVAQWLDALAFK